MNVCRCRYVMLVAAGYVMLGTAVASGQVQQGAAQVASEHGADIRGVLARPVDVNLKGVSLVAAIQALTQSAKVRAMYEAGQLKGATSPVTFRADGMALGVALDRVLRGTGLRVVPVSDEVVAIRLFGATMASVAEGSITGKVVDGKTRQGLRGATITLVGTNKGTMSRDDGAFRISDIGLGSYTLQVRMLGYVKFTKPVTIREGQATSIDIALEPSVNALDQVIVTGTVIPTELKAVPNAITVITAKQIEERGITKIDQLFRGDVPGLFVQNQGSSPTALLDEVTMFSRGATALSSTVAGTVVGANPIKTYVDGVELADPKYLSQIDPRSIERIEILTGPQASTIYGSNALNGVMQIFTKRGATSKPQLTLNLMSGWVENNFSDARTPQHDYSAQLSGIEGRFSYNAGGSWNYIGPWTPAKQTARLDGFGGARLDLPIHEGRVTADITLRRSLTKSRQRGATAQVSTAYRETGWYTNSSSSGVAAPTTYTITGQTLGLTLTYAPISWWSHELGIGSDASETENRTTAPGYASGISDTALSLLQNHVDRRSLRYATTVHIPIASLAHLTVTAGVDSWQSLTSSLTALPQTLTGSLTNVTSVSRLPDHNTGTFLQSQIDFTDRLFFTYGLRAEWNPAYGEEEEPNYAPRFGVAYTQDVGPITFKLRGSYGRSTRPPESGLKAAQTIAEAFGSSWPSYSSWYLPYNDGIFDDRLANPDLGPEHQQGGEGGLELYFGTHASLVVTRYNQTVDGLISNPAVDSVRSSLPCLGVCIYYDNIDADGYGYVRQYKFLNIGSIRNQGWELHGSFYTGPFITRGTYSLTKSRVIGVTPVYRALFANQPAYTPGASFQYLPEHTWAFGMTYASGLSSVTFNMTGAGRVTKTNDDFNAKNLSSGIRLQQNRLNMNLGRGYVNFNAPYALADLTASHRFTSGVEGVLQVQNLGDTYRNDYQSAYASLGRQVKVGARIRL